MPLTTCHFLVTYVRRINRLAWSNTLQQQFFHNWNMCCHDTQCPSYDYPEGHRLIELSVFFCICSNIQCTELCMTTRQVCSMTVLSYSHNIIKICCWCDYITVIQTKYVTEVTFFPECAVCTSNAPLHTDMEHRDAWPGKQTIYSTTLQQFQILTRPNNRQHAICLLCIGKSDCCHTCLWK